jgi:ATP-dependent DNA ligase
LRLFRRHPLCEPRLAAQVVKKLPEGDDWLYEVKFDGYRGLLIKDWQRVSPATTEAN